jgi:hypothetical protein
VATAASELLAACYRNSIALAAEHQLATIAFPAVSTGVYAYPKDEAAEVSRSPQVANGTCARVSVEFERVRKAIDVRPAETDMQATKGLGGAKIVVQHRGLLG